MARRQPGRFMGYGLERLPLEEVRADVGLFLDRIIVAINTIGDQRVARDDRVLAWLDRTEADHGGLLAAIPFERRRALRLFAGRDRIGEDRAFDEGLHRLQPI